jgi:retron-type reverse transcriptase
MNRVIAYNGGYWTGDANLGLFYVNVNLTSSFTNTPIGARLASSIARRQNLTGLCPVQIIWSSHPSFRFCRNGKDKPGGAASRQITNMPNVAPITQKETMPKTYNNLWEKIITWENLHRSYLEARTGKRYAAAVLRFQKNLEENIIDIQNRLMWYQWRPGRWHEFVVKEPKIRLIQAPPFADRVVHHALVDIISPLFEKKFIADSYACRQGKGFHSASKRIQQFTRKAQSSGPVYVLQADIAKYFPSIHHDTMMDILARTIRDKDVLWLCCIVIKRSGFDYRGIPVGALTSQLFANIYLDQLDHYIKDDLGVKFYARYMDDFVIISNDKQQLRDLLGRIEQFLQDRLHLDLNPKTDIFPVSRGIDFCGYRVWPSHILPRKRIMKRARKALGLLARLCSSGRIPLSKYRDGIMSFLGYAKHCDSNDAVNHILQESFVRRSYQCK